MKNSKSHPDPQPLRVLILEDNPVDAEMVERELRRGGITFDSLLVEGKKEYSQALADMQPQVILSDFKLPRFEGLAALEIARLLAPDVPFIFVSGSIGEEKAIETLAQGAADFIFKDNLQRLGPAVKRVVEAVQLKLEKEKNDAKLQRHVEELRLLAEAADRFVHINDLDEIYEYLAQTIRAISGADYLLLSLYDEKLQAVRPKIVIGFDPFRETISRRFGIDPTQMIFYLKDMRKDDFSDFVSRRLLPVRDGLYGLANRKMPRAICRLIEKMLSIGSMHTMGFSWENQLFGGLTVLFKKGNELKNASQVEALVHLATVAIKRLLAEKSLCDNEEHLRQSEEYYRTLVETSPDAIIIIDAGGRVTFASHKTIEIFGIPAQTTIIGISIMDFVEPGDIPRVQERMVEILSGRSLPKINEYRLLKHDRRPFWGEISSSPLRDASGRNVGLLLICRDVSERKQAESQRQTALEALSESEDRYRDLVENSRDFICTHDLEGKILTVNKATVQLTGYPLDDLLSMNMTDLLAPGVRHLSKAYLAEIQATGRAQGTLRIQTSAGEIRHWEYDNTLRTKGVAVPFVRAVAHDITERDLAEAEIMREKAFLEALVETAPEGIAITDCPGRVLQVNREFVNMFGYEAVEVIGKKIDDLVAPLEYLDEADAITQSVGAGKPIVLESVRKRKGGTLFNVSIIGAPIRIAGQQVAVYAIYRDITERKQAEEQIRASLKEKEVLLQEIHHRVNNNLQIISGLLTLQADRAAGKSIDEVFRESQDRIRSIAMIHEKLYRSQSLAEIAFDEYLRDLIANLFAAHSMADGRITAKYEMESILFTIEKAIPLGLIVNELVTNALKHAFPAGRQGEIRIGLHGYKGAKSYAQKTDSGTLHCVPTCELIVADDGVGLPAGQIPEQQKSLGMNLVSMLAKQLQAELKVKTGPGAEFRFLFSGLPANKAAKDKLK